MGDALGTTLEFQPRDAAPPLLDLVGGGPFKLEAGQWTDDTAMALALAESLLHDPKLNEHDLMLRFVDWYENGAYSCTGSCFDIGRTTASALLSFKRTGNPIAGSEHPSSAGNGSLMRVAPVAIRFWREPDRLTEIAVKQSITTHAAAEAVQACVLFAHMLAKAIAGADRKHVFRERQSPHNTVSSITGGSWRTKSRDQISSSGYVLHSLEAALWSVGTTSTFEDAVLTAANLGEDADTTASITGQLAGAIHGASAIPHTWLRKLAWRERLQKTADALFEAAYD